MRGPAGEKGEVRPEGRRARVGTPRARPAAVSKVSRAFHPRAPTHPRMEHAARARRRGPSRPRGPRRRTEGWPTGDAGPPPEDATGRPDPACARRMPGPRRRLPGRERRGRPTAATRERPGARAEARAEQGSDASAGAGAGRGAREREGGRRLRDHSESQLHARRGRPGRGGPGWGRPGGRGRRRWRRACGAGGNAEGLDSARRARVGEAPPPWAAAPHPALARGP